MTTPAPALEERIAVLETLVNDILPTLATKSDIAEVKTEIAGVKTEIARLAGKTDAVNERLEGKIDTVGEQLEGKIDAFGERLEGKIDAFGERLDAMGNSLLIKFVGVTIPIAAIAVAVVKYL